MRYRPTFEEFVELTRSAVAPVGLVPVYRQLIGDTLTPVSAFCKIQEGDWSFLFESVIGGERLGRYSFVGSGPFLRFQAFGNRVRIDEATPGGQVQSRSPKEFEHPDPLRLLEERLAAYRAPTLPGLRRGRRLCRLRCRPLRRTPAQGAAG
jgi:anthranilate synthase component 1